MRSIKSNRTCSVEAANIVGTWLNADIMTDSYLHDVIVAIKLRSIDILHFRHEFLFYSVYETQKFVKKKIANVMKAIYLVFFSLIVCFYSLVRWTERVIDWERERRKTKEPYHAIFAAGQNALSIYYDANWLRWIHCTLFQACTQWLQ